MTSFNPISIFIDSRRVTRGTPEMLAARQQERLNELVNLRVRTHASMPKSIAACQRTSLMCVYFRSAEPLSDENRLLIQQAFGVPPRNNYGCSEGGVMGYECNHGQMHINADWIIFEPVDANHDPVPAGQLSDRTLITNLANRVMPIIRYELGDRVTLLREKCDCGITLPLIKVEGRTDEILRFKSPSGGSIPVLPLALWSVLKETLGVLRFQAIQPAPDTLKIRLEAKHAEGNEAVWKRVYVNARNYLTQQGLGNVTIVRAEEPPMRDPKSGKFRNVWAEKFNP